MARRSHNSDSNSDRNKFRLFYAEFDGGSQTVQEMMRAFTQTIARGQSPGVQSPGLLQGDTNVDDNAEVAVEEIDVVHVDELQPEARPKKPPAQKKDYNAGIKAVPGIDFMPNGKQSLKDFLAAKAPKTALERALVLCYYMQGILELDKFGIEHVLTAHKHAQLRIPTDLPSTLRNMKAKAWLSYSDLQQLSVATEGENIVLHELPKQGNKAK